MQPTSPVPSETAKVRAALAERLSGFPLIQSRTLRDADDQANTRAYAAGKQLSRRFSGEPITGFGALL